MKTLTRIVLVVALMLIWAPAFAQQTTGSIIGRVVDAQGAALAGATVTATNTETGFVRSVTSDAEGLYRQNALPVGPYDVVTELQGFTRLEQRGVIVNVAQATSLDAALRLAPIAETVTVMANARLFSTTSSSVGQIVDIARIESLPLNGRQFANLAATVTGVGLGFHADLTKST